MPTEDIEFKMQRKMNLCGRSELDTKTCALELVEELGKDDFACVVFRSDPGTSFVTIYKYWVSEVHTSLNAICAYIGNERITLDKSYLDTAFSLAIKNCNHDMGCTSQEMKKLNEKDYPYCKGGVATGVLLKGKVDGYVYGPGISSVTDYNNYIYMAIFCQVEKLY